jgi:holo-[acyl-carrier protein] synthase
VSVAAVAGRRCLGASSGIGVDAVDVARFRRCWPAVPGSPPASSPSFEQADAARVPDPTESLAARFAAKEAVMKALGTGIGGFALTDVEVPLVWVGATGNAPYLVLHGAAAALADRHRRRRFHLSLTHTTDVAIAFVVAERSPSCSPS